MTRRNEDPFDRDAELPSAATAAAPPTTDNRPPLVRLLQHTRHGFLVGAALVGAAVGLLFTVRQLLDAESPPASLPHNSSITITVGGSLRLAFLQSDLQFSSRRPKPIEVVAHFGMNVRTATCGNPHVSLRIEP